jgi:hypothetical protein
MSLQYIVASPGRSGSVFTTLVVTKSLKLTALFDDKQSLHINSPAILHTHNAHFQAGEYIPVSIKRGL